LARPELVWIETGLENSLDVMHRLMRNLTALVDEPPHDVMEMIPRPTAAFTCSMEGG
jgi:hypothetical protein